MDHHESTLERFTGAQAADPEVLGVIVVGSVARGEARPESDVDVYVVLTDPAYEAALAAGSVARVSHEGVTYAGGYVDIKLASPTYLSRAVAEADDPTRASLIGARVSFDRTGALAGLVEAITELPARVWPERVDAYRAQLGLYAGYFLRQAVERGDDFLLRHASVHACLAAGRLALAKNRRLFRGQKYLQTDLACLTDTPDGYLECWSRLLSQPSTPAGEALLAMTDAWLGDRPTLDQTLGRFITDNELAWLTGRTPPEFW